MGDAARVRSEPRRVYVMWSMARALVGCIVLAATFAIHSTPSRDEYDTPQLLTGVAVLIFASTLAMAVGMVAARDIEWMAPYVVALDTLIVAAIVYLTGASTSPLVVLFGANVLISAVLIDPRAPYPVAVASVSVFGLVVVGLSNGVLPIPYDQAIGLYTPTVPELALSLVSTSTGLLLVSLLASTLARRLSAAGGALEDATKRADALERRNSDIIRSLSSGLMTSDLDGHIETANAMALQILRQALDELVGRAISDFLPLPVLDTQGIEPHRVEGIARRADGTDFPVGLTATRLLDAQGAHQGTVVSFLDLTEIARLQEAARAAEQLAALGRIAAGLAHEIRNPLSSISASVELVRESPALVPEETRLLGIVLSEVERLDDLVHTMLDLAKPRRPRPQLSELSAIAREIAHMAELGVAGKSGVNVLVEASPGATADVDPDQIRQVIWNLLKNAVHSSAEGKRVWIRVIDEGRDIALEVRDEGKGLGPTEAGQLFEMFRTGSTHGTGIGLALVKQIVDAHGGSVHAYDLEPRGACFRVVLPKESELSGRLSVESIP